MNAGRGCHCCDCRNGIAHSYTDDIIDGLLGLFVLVITCTAIYLGFIELGHVMGIR